MKRVFILLCFLSFSFSSTSTHLMGGEITYTCIDSGPNAGYYVFNVVIYRDCQGIPIDTMTNLNVHNHPSLQTINLNYIESNDISPQCNTIDGQNMMYSCGGNNLGYSGNGVGAVEEHIYRSDTIRIIGSPDLNGWHFTWSDCCRNGSIINIDNPNNYGFTLRTTMYPFVDSSGITWPNNDECFDNSPVFYEKPRTILETNNGYNSSSILNGFTYSHNAYDQELDSLSYEFAPPLDESGYDYLNPNSTSIPFVPPFSFNIPINSISMDTYTGRTSYPANLQGNYVTCTKVSSYRCGQLISEVFREVQVVLSAPICNLGDTTNGNSGADTLCNVRPVVQPPFYYQNMSPQYQWDTIVHCGDTVNFDFIANDYDYYPNGSRQDLLFEVSGGQFYDYLNNQPCQNPPCATFNEIGTGSVPPFISSGGSGGGVFNWVTDCNHLLNPCNTQGPSIFSFVIKVADDFCPAPAIENTAQVISIIVYPSCDNLKTNISVSNSSCNLNDGSVTSNPYGGTPPYTKYFLDLNGNPVNPDSLYSGSYIVKVVDSTLCEAVDTFVVNGPVSINISSTVSNIDCNGGNNGSIDVFSNSFLSYLWNTGDTTQDLDSLSAGIYNLSIVDSFGCTISQSFTITEPDVIYYTSTYSDVSCNSASDGSVWIDSVSGGVPNYTYIWSTGDTVQNLINLSPGIYNVSIYDVNLCSISSNFIISEPPLLTNQISSSNVTCNGYNDANILNNPSGGISPYTFSWNTNDTTQNLNNVTAGIYVFNLFDDNGCLHVDSVVVSQPDTLNSDLILNGDTLTASCSGGTPPYLYEFYNSNGIYLSSTNATGSDVSINLPSLGVYSFVVTDANNCIDSTGIIYGNYFDPMVDVLLSNLYCDSLADLTITVSQDSGQVDMGTALFQSNAGYFDISSLNVGDTIGTADLMAGGGSIIVNTMLVVSSIISTSQAIITPCSWASGCLGSFVITNSLGGGIEMLSQTVPDGNNFTQGNMSSITFDNLFVNPCSQLIFTSIINSELGDVDSQSITFQPTSIEDNNKILDILIYPNPSHNIFNVKFTSLEKQDLNVRIINSVGEIIYHNHLNDHIGEYSNSISLEAYSKSIYFLEIETDDWTIYRKLILQ